MRSWKCSKCDRGPCWTATKDDDLDYPVCGCVCELEIDVDTTRCVWRRVDPPLDKLSNLSTFLRVVDAYEEEFLKPENEWLWDAQAGAFDALDPGAKEVARMLRRLDEEESEGYVDVAEKIKRIPKTEILRAGVSSGFLAGATYCLAVKNGWRDANVHREDY